MCGMGMILSGTCVFFAGFGCGNDAEEIDLGRKWVRKVNLGVASVSMSSLQGIIWPEIGHFVLRYTLHLFHALKLTKHVSLYCLVACFPFHKTWQAYQPPPVPWSGGQAYDPFHRRRRRRPACRPGSAIRPSRPYGSSPD